MHAPAPFAVGLMLAILRYTANLLGAALVLAGATLVMAGTASAADWLVLVVDRSNSIDADELALQRRAYVSVLNDEVIVAALEKTSVAIVEFDNSAEVVVPWTDVRDAAAQYAQWHAAGARGGTGIGHGLRAALDLLQAKSGRRVVDVSGDGRENRDSVLLEQWRNDATAAGIRINGLVIGGRTLYDLKRYYQQNVANGFVMEIDDVADFRAALKRKILQETMTSQRF